MIKDDIPERYKDADFSQVRKGIQDLVVEFGKNIKENKGVYIYGLPGRGKTYTAWAIAKYIESLGFRAVVVKSASVVDAIKKTFEPLTDDSEPFYDYLEVLRNYKGLVIFDDIGAEKYPEGVIVPYFGLIDYRYEHMLPMCFTSNVSISELADRMSDRIASRISEICNIIKIEGEDRR